MKTLFAFASIILILTALGIHAANKDDDDDQNEQQPPLTEERVREIVREETEPLIRENKRLRTKQNNTRREHRAEKIIEAKEKLGRT